jgi:hypothetical protein
MSSNGVSCNELRKLLVYSVTIISETAKNSIGDFVSFAMTHICEIGLSGLLHTKTKVRNRLEVSYKRVAISKKEFRFKEIIKKK